jgi:hypothetical protein
VKPWLYKGKPLTSAPEGYYGFIYVIKDKDTGRAYIGKKCFFHKLTRPPLKGKTRRRVDRKESNWKVYWGSCDELLKDIKTYGEELFTREIVLLCRTRAEHTYAEVEAQVKNDVLTARLPNGEWAYYNSNILSRFFR